MANPIIMSASMRKLMAKLGRRGGEATQSNRTPAERSIAANKAANARWDKVRAAKRAAKKAAKAKLAADAGREEPKC